MAGSARPERNLPVTVCSEGGAPERARAAALADRLGLALRVPDPTDAGPVGRPTGHRRARRTGNHGWCLAATPDGLLLIGPNGARTAPRFVDGRAATHAREHDLAGQPLARALGIAALGTRLRRGVEMLDATAGFGTDAWLAAALGARVTMAERDPVVHALLADALARAREGGDERTRTVAARLSLTLVEPARSGWPASVDVVYLDPMYPDRRVRGGQRKQIDALQGIVGHDAHNDTLLDDALRIATTRVVVKRPRGAEPLHSPDGHRPNDALSGPNTRYDRYLGRAGAQ